MNESYLSFDKVSQVVISTDVEGSKKLSLMRLPRLTKTQAEVTMSFTLSDRLIFKEQMDWIGCHEY